MWKYLIPMQEFMEYVRLCEYSQKTLSVLQTLFFLWLYSTYWWKMFKTLHIMGLKNGQSDIKVGYVGLSVEYSKIVCNFSIKLHIYIMYFIFFGILLLCSIIVLQQYNTIIYVFISFRNLKNKCIHVFYFKTKLKNFTIKYNYL